VRQKQTGKLIEMVILSLVKEKENNVESNIERVYLNDALRNQNKAFCGQSKVNGNVYISD